MGLNLFALTMGLLLAATGFYGPRLMGRLGLIRAEQVASPGRLSRLVWGAVVVMGLGLALSGVRLSGGLARAAIVASTVMMLAGLLAIVVVLLIAIRGRRR